MSFDTFAHAVFGVEVAESRLRELRQSLANTESPNPDAVDVSSRVDDPHLQDPATPEIIKVTHELREGYRQPEAALIYTGDEDSRLGCCDVGPDAYLFGYGVLCVNEISRELLAAFAAEGATWHFWVTGS